MRGSQVRARLMVLFLLSPSSWAVLSYSLQAVTTSSQTRLHMNLTILVFWWNVLWCMPILHRLMKTHELQLAHKSTTAGISVLVCSITHIVLHCQHSLVMALQHCGCFEAVLLAGKVQRGVAVLGTQWGYTFTYGGTQLKNTQS